MMKSAEAEFEQIFKDSGESFPKSLRRLHDNDYTVYNVIAFAQLIAIKIHVAGQRFPESEIIELAIRLACWTGEVGRTRKMGWTEVKLSAQVRAASTAAFIQRVPEWLRDILKIDQHDDLERILWYKVVSRAEV